MRRRLGATQGNPIPLWNLVAMKDYAAMNIQYGRGCPFDCEFCDITALFAANPAARLWHSSSPNWRAFLPRAGGSGVLRRRQLHRRQAKAQREILPAIIDWMERRAYPFYFYTEASIDLADDPS